MAANNATPETTPAEPTTTATLEFKAPQERSIRGILLGSDAIQTETTDIVLLTIQDTENAIHKISTSPKYWDKVSRSFMGEEPIVEVKFEVRVAGKTGYKTNDGVVKIHASNGTNLTNISRFSSRAYQALLDEQSKENDMIRITTAEDSKVSAVAQYLAAYVKK